MNRLLLSFFMLFCTLFSRADVPWNANSFVSAKSAESSLLGDANNDGTVNVNDISTIATYILDGHAEPFVFANADVNGDGVINVNDISATAIIILGDSPSDSPNVASAFVSTNPEAMTVLECDTAAGKFRVSFNGTVPKIDAGSVIILSTDSTNFVVLVTKAQTVDNVVSMDGVIGDLSYVFSDSQFVLKTGKTDDEAPAYSKNVFYPIQPNVKRASGSETLWSTSGFFKNDIINKNNGHLWTESTFNASIIASWSFNFGAPVETFIQGIKFIRAGNFDVDFSVTGDVNATYDVFFNASGKGKIDLAPNSGDKYALLKHNLFPQRTFPFPIGPVTIPITVGCDLFADVSLSYDANLDFTTGIGANASGTVGVSYDGVSNTNFRPYSSMSLGYDKHYPTLEGKGVLEGKAHIFPRIHAWICGVIGPTLDIKPYAKVTAGGSFKEVLGSSTEDYIAASLKTFVGLDVAIGLSQSWGNYEVWNKSTGDINIAEYQLYESPVDVKYKGDSKKNDGTIDVSFEVYDRGIGGTTFLSPLWPIVKFEAEGTLSSQYAMAQSGVVTVNWKPKQKPSKLYAKIFDLDGNVIAQAEYECEGIHTCPDNNHPHAIDLGLPSGTKWCCCNVGATTPEGYGGYYAWGETSEKSVYNEVTYKYSTGEDTDGDGWYDRNWQYQNIGSDIAGSQYDVAHVRMGAPWRMPSTEQQQELIQNCTRTWTQQNGVNGTLVTGKNGGQIFLPAAGYRWDDSLYGAGSYGDFWSSSLDPSYDYDACGLYFYSGSWNWRSNYRGSGQSVRAVCP